MGNHLALRAADRRPWPLARTHTLPLVTAVPAGWRSAAHVGARPRREGIGRKSIDIVSISLSTHFAPDQHTAFTEERKNNATNFFEMRNDVATSAQHRQVAKG